MKSFQVLIGVTSLAVLLAACAEQDDQTTDEQPAEEVVVDDESQPEQDAEIDGMNEEEIEEESAENESEPESEEEVQTVEEDPVETETEEQPYQEEQVEDAYTLTSTRTQATDEHPLSLFTIAFERVEDDTSLEERLKQSLTEGDTTSNQVLEELDELTIEGQTASLIFTEDVQITLASTEQLQFQEMLFELSALYGINQLDFFVEDEQGVSFGETGELDGLEVEKVGTRGYFVVTDNDVEGSTYVSGAYTELEYYNDEVESLDFADAVEHMRAVEEENVLYTSGIPDSIEIDSAELNDGVAEIHFTQTEDTEWTEEQIEDFEHVLQLTALDYEAEELILVNETERARTVFSFSN
ncbi:hypothetical protein [Alkalicoccobacillus porphyridii]|uniref:GerMN domain-containing protein n=1 Tax=Alkalicoccobacillus porphyridii TaxID=2597270 RepID=A0A554A2J2_9BACI|nr:hypothetical protein [Alkalicoccobacillus porphyridii]TSB47911.1 hypothetical protein FN960_05235 [Alkalicoccobacillus porphyridii]